MRINTATTFLKKDIDLLTSAKKFMYVEYDPKNKMFSHINVSYVQTGQAFEDVKISTYECHDLTSTYKHFTESIDLASNAGFEFDYEQLQALDQADFLESFQSNAGITKH